jgi:hypothetical protein
MRKPSARGVESNVVMFVKYVYRAPIPRRSVVATVA